MNVYYASLIGQADFMIHVHVIIPIKIVCVCEDGDCL